MAQNSIPYNPTATVEPSLEGSGASYQSVPQASPAAFGAQIGENVQKLGQAGEEFGNKTIDLASHFAQMATEAKANDIIANQFAPAAAKLKQDFYQKQGIDAINGQPAYQASLGSLRDQFLAQAKSPYEKQILSSWMSRHAAQENDGAALYAGQQLTKFEDQSHQAMLDTTTANMVGNYNQPNVVASNMQVGMALIQKHGIDRGLTGDEGQEIIKEQQRQFTGKAAQDMVGRAVAAGDITTAQSLYGQYGDKISGPEQLAIDKMMHAENMRQFGTNAASALLAGKPIPNAPIGPPAQVKATIADTAQNNGVDPAQALAVASIESNFGQNVGKRGDVGQTGKGGDIPEQASNMVGALKQSKALADTATGRTSEPWEQYVVYQQGSGGGPALLKAAATTPTAKAVDVLAPIYGNQKDALSAVTNNGGNATMSAGQFLDFIKNKYNAHAERVSFDIPQPSTAQAPNPLPNDQSVITAVPPKSVGAAITAPHEIGGLTMQPGASPVQRLIEMDKVFPDALMRANQIPNLDQREAAINGLEQQRRVYQGGAQAYTTTLINQAEQLAVDPKFTDPNTIPPELRAALIEDHPQTLAYMEARANYNLEHASGGVSKDAKEYGPGFYDLFKGVHADVGNANRITDVTQLQSHVGPNGDITMAGYDKLVKELQGKNTPDGDAEGKMREQSFKVVKSIVSGEDELGGMKDPKGEELYAKAMPLIYKAIEDGKAKGLTNSQLYDPSSKDWVGNAAKGLKRTPAQQAADLINSNGGGPPTTYDTPAAAVRALSSGTLSRQQFNDLAVQKGWARGDTAPQVPTGP